MTAEMVGHPEDDPTCPLNVDALVDIDGVVWAVDHMRLVYEPDLVPAVDEVGEVLRAALERVAVEYDRYLVVVYVPPGLGPWSVVTPRSRSGGSSEKFRWSTWTT
jgi:hypothetical protein